MKAAIPAPMREVRFAGGARALVRELAVECPVAIEVNGIGYAVMMATPADLEDYALGFALSEGLVASAADLLDVAIAEIARGVILRLTLAPERAAPIHERVRMRVSEGSCGLCGLESIDEVLRPLPWVGPGRTIAPEAIQAALAALPAHQELGGRTGATHAAAFCSPTGEIRLAREDVGRHNALDKLVGALARGGIDPGSGFMLVSARCSYELVEKAVRAGCPVLVAISAPTSLAAERAQAAGLTLIALARQDTMLVLGDTAEAPMETADGL
jgi:FdhD protein